LVKGLPSFLPRGNTLDDEVWKQRHRLLQAVLAIHLPGLLIFGMVNHKGFFNVTHYLAAPLLCLILGMATRRRRLASFLITAGLVYCSAALVALSGGKIEAHFHFFILIGFIALYQDWVPFVWNIVFTVLSHGLGSAVRTDLIFDHHAAQAAPWTWSFIHGIAVLFACVGVVLFWKNTEREQEKALALAHQLGAADKERSTSSLLVNLARRNQSLQYRQLELINRLEEAEQDPDALAELFRLDHLATRIRRNSESLLVLAGEEPTRTWTQPVLLVDVIQASIAEIEDMERVEFVVNEQVAVIGRAVADLTHLLAEVIENAVSFSPPEVNVSVRSRPHLSAPGAWVVTVEDWGVGMRLEDLAGANELLQAPSQVDLATTRQLGLHVVARLAQRYKIHVSLSPTAGGGVTAAVVLPPSIFAERQQAPALAGRTRHALQAAGGQELAALGGTSTVVRQTPKRLASRPSSGGPGAGPAWWEAPSRQGGGVPAIELLGDQHSGQVEQLDQEPERTWSEPAEPRPEGGAAPFEHDAGHQLDTGEGDAGEARAGTGYAPDPADVRGRPRRARVFDLAEQFGWTGGTGAPNARNGHPEPPPRPADPDADHHSPDTHGHEGPGGHLVQDHYQLPASGHGQGDGAGDHDGGPGAPGRGGPGDEDGGTELTGGLERRVPQAHLSPHLRRAGGAQPAAPGGAAAVPDPSRAREALSRFQSNRQAAWAAVEEARSTEPGPNETEYGR
jgi:signal transduction histidine kinase